MLRLHAIAICVAVLGLATSSTAAWACMPASGPSETAEQVAARQAAFQAGLWAESDTVLIAAVTGSDVSDRTLRVTLAPSLVIKGQAPLPASFEASDRMTNCRPGGMMGAGGVGVGEVYIVYRQNDGDLVVHEDRLVDPATRNAWDAARRASAAR